MGEASIWGEGLETIGGVTKSRMQWCREKGLPLRLVKQRVTYSKWPFEKALTEPLRAKRTTSHGRNASPAVRSQTERMKRYFEREYGDYGRKRR